MIAWSKGRSSRPKKRKSACCSSFPHYQDVCQALNLASEVALQTFTVPATALEQWIGSRPNLKMNEWAGGSKDIVPLLDDA